MTRRSTIELAVAAGALLALTAPRAAAHELVPSDGDRDGSDAGAPRDLASDFMLGANTAGGYVPRSMVGVAVMAGGGVSEFAGSDMRATTGPAGAWDLRLVAGTRMYVGLEAAYTGAAYQMTGLTPAGAGTLLRNGAEGVVRLQAPLSVGRAMFEPYLFAGLGWAHYSVQQTAGATADLTPSDDVMTVPLGAGWSAEHNGLIADVRVTYRPTYRENMLLRPTDNGLTSWTAGVAAGYEF